MLLLLLLPAAAAAAVFVAGLAQVWYLSYLGRVSIQWQYHRSTSQTRSDQISPGPWHTHTVIHILLFSAACMSRRYTTISFALRIHIYVNRDGLRQDKQHGAACLRPSRLTYRSMSLITYYYWDQYKLPLVINIISPCKKRWSGQDAKRK